MSNINEQDNFGSCVLDFTTLDGAAHCLDFCSSNYNWFREHHYRYDWFRDQIQIDYWKESMCNFCMIIEG